jgi:hypothetical protein
MPLQRTTTYVRSAPARKRNTRYNKKTTRRGAYKPRKKRQMMNRRSPFVETKSKTHEDLVVQFPGLVDRTEFRTQDAQVVHMNPETFLMWKRGMEENEVIGNSCYAKYLKMKIGIRFPQSAFTLNGSNKQIPMTPQNYELIWGFVPNEFGFTGQTTPTASEANINDLMSHINQRVLDYVDQQKDRLRYIPKAASTIRIVGRRKIRPDMRFQSTAPPQTLSNVIAEDNVIGVIPDRYTSVSWKMMRKLHLQPTSKLHSGQTGLYAGNFGAWIPFCCLVNWDYDNLPVGTTRELYCPSIQYNDVCYYSDS